MLVDDYEEQIESFETELRAKNKAKPKKTSTKSDDTKWDEAVKVQKATAAKELRIARDKAEIEAALADEARRVAQEAERVEMERARDETRRRAEIEAKIRKENERIKQAILEDLYKPLAKPIVIENKAVVSDLRRIGNAPKRMNSRVPTLWNLCIAFVCENILLYEGFENVPILWKSSMYKQLSSKKQLSAEKFELLLDPMQSVLDLSICRLSVCHEFFPHFSKSPFLTSLTITNCPQLTFVAVKLIGAHCPNLEKLNLSGCYNISTLEGISGCKNLRELNLSDCSLLCDAMNRNGINNISTLQELRSLNLSYVESIPSMSLLLMLQTLPNLEHYDITGSGHPLGAEKILVNPIVSNKLKSLHLQYTRSNMNIQWISPEVFDYLFNSKSFPDLETLSITLSNNLESASILQKHPKLQNLSLVMCTKIKNFAIFPSGTDEASYVVPPNIRSISFDDYYGLADSELVKQVVSTQVPLTHITFLNMKQSSVENIIKLFRNQDVNLHEFIAPSFGETSMVIKTGSVPYLLPFDVDWKSVQFHRHENLKVIDFSFTSWMKRKIFKSLVNSTTTPNLEYINIAGCQELHTQSFLQYLLTSFDNLNTLKIGSILQIDWVSLFTGLNEGKKIQNMEISFRYDAPYMITEESWKIFFQSFPKLRTLFCTAAPQGYYTKVSILGLLEMILEGWAPYLKSLTVLGSKGYNRKYITYFTENVKNLEILKFDYTDFENELSDTNPNAKCQLINKSRFHNFEIRWDNLYGTYKSIKPSEKKLRQQQQLFQPF
eukprot:TRINITY_DN1437_c0_g1_i2.p1 TRINITY_DN1437_c0_g1~~TRINITY_DN1437_c0_g1_i2.p1  ORF type:complete len:778 (+),score=149.81 TRINITY_DN1437_c0_g1_i2:280-2613(+)